MHTSIVTPDSHTGTVRKVFTETDEKNTDTALSPAWEQLHFLQLTARPFENYLAVANLDTRIRFGFEGYEGDFRFRGTLKLDALYLEPVRITPPAILRIGVSLWVSKGYGHKHPLEADASALPRQPDDDRVSGL